MSRSPWRWHSCFLSGPLQLVLRGDMEIPPPPCRCGICSVRYGAFSAQL